MLIEEYLNELCVTYRNVSVTLGCRSFKLEPFSETSVEKVSHYRETTWNMTIQNQVKSSKGPPAEMMNLIILEATARVQHSLSSLCFILLGVTAGPGCGLLEVK